VNEPDDTLPPEAAKTIPAPAMIELFDSIDQEAPDSGTHLREPHAMRIQLEDFNGFASEELDEVD